jgi:hypothetical protein
MVFFFSYILIKKKKKIVQHQDQLTTSTFVKIVDNHINS